MYHTKQVSARESFTSLAFHRAEVWQSSALLLSYKCRSLDWVQVWFSRAFVCTHAHNDNNTYAHNHTHLGERCCESVSHSVTKTKLRHSPNRGSALCLYSSRYLSLPENGLLLRPASLVSSLLLHSSDNLLWRTHTHPFVLLHIFQVFDSLDFKESLAGIKTRIDTVV